MIQPQDDRYMALALSLGRRGQGRVWPNPAVGCVIVKDGVIVGRATTAPGGRPHAEPQALAQACDAARGATAYVTLEPCSHTGKTPPCAYALIAAGVARVVVAATDPDPRVSGRGLTMLRDAGIDVTEGVRAEEAARDHAGFFLRVTQGRPFVTLKMAGTLDGRIATATGDSQWITGAQARRRVHAMRLSHDAVMVGAGTVLADDPSLTVRGFGPVAQPVRVVVTRSGKVPVDSNLGRTASETPVWLCHGAGAEVDGWIAAGATGLPCDVTAGQVDPVNLLTVLGEQGLTRVFCEGGGMLAASLLQADLVDELVVFSGGVAIGAEGTPMLAAMGIDRLKSAPRFALKSVEQIGVDICHVWGRV